MSLDKPQSAMMTNRRKLGSKGFRFTQNIIEKYAASPVTPMSLQ